jgi:hypothetical protein
VALPEHIRHEAKLAVKDEYIFDFLELADEFREFQFEKAILEPVWGVLRKWVGYIFRWTPVPLGWRQGIFIDLLLFHRLRIVDSIGNGRKARVSAPQFFVSLMTVAKIALRSGKALKIASPIFQCRGQDIGPEIAARRFFTCQRSVHHGLRLRPSSIPHPIGHRELCPGRRVKRVGRRPRCSLSSECVAAEYQATVCPSTSDRKGDWRFRVLTFTLCLVLHPNPNTAFRDGFVLSTGTSPVVFMVLSRNTSRWRSANTFPLPEYSPSRETSSGRTSRKVPSCSPFPEMRARVLRSGLEAGLGKINPDCGR